jgi:hypothetical protein
MFRSSSRAMLCAALLSVAFTPLPRAVADGGPAPVENLTGRAEIGLVTLHWTYPAGAGVQQAVVCEQQGTTALTSPTAWCLENGIETSDSAMRGAAPFRDYTWTVWSQDSNGDLGPARSVTTLGSLTTMSTVPSDGDADPGLRLAGRLVDASSGRPEVGKTIEVFLGHRATTYTYPEWNLVTRLTTDSQGNFARTFPLRPGLSYQARFQGDGNRMGNLSKLVPADGSSYIDLDDEDPWGARTRKVRLVARPGVLHRGDKVVFQKLRKGHWRQVGVRGVASGRAVFQARVPSRSKVAFRAVLRSAGRAAQPSVPVKLGRR